MEKMVLIQLSIEEFREIIQEEIQLALANHQPKKVIAEKEIMMIEDAAAFLKISKSTIYKKTSSGLIPHYKQGKRLIFKRTDLVKWITAGKQITAADIEQQTMDYLARRRRL